MESSGFYQTQTEASSATPVVVEARMKSGGGNGLVCSDIGPNDVLLGRGSRIYQNPGNVAFRRLVATRQLEYSESITVKEKNRIAQEVVEQVRCRTCIDSPGRFLSKVDESVAKTMGFPDGVEMWSLADESTVLEKAKQSLRQHQRWGGGERQKRPPGRKRVESSVSKDPRVSQAARSAVSEVNVDAQKSNRISGAPKTDDPVFPAQLVHNGTALAYAVEKAKQTLQMHREQRKMPIRDRLEPSTTKDTGSIMGDDTTLLSTLHSSIMSEEGGLAVAGITNQTESNREEGGGKSRDERSSLFEAVFRALELVNTVQEGHGKGVKFGSSIGGGGPQGKFCVDLVSLGSALYHHFSGIVLSGVGEVSTSTHSGTCSVAEMTQRKTKKERRPTQNKYVPLRDLGFPVSLCIMVSSLLDLGGDGAVDLYQTTDEVEEDLRLMLANPERYLFDAGTDMLRGQLEFSPGKLYGREQDISKLMSVFERVTGSDNPSEVVLICGYSGTGKSMLIDQLRQPLFARNGHFISGKFDELAQTQPMSVIFTAFNDFCGHLVEGSEDQISRIRRSISAALGSNINVLTGVIPNLGTVMRDNTPSLLHIGGKEALNRFLLHFRLFVRAIASPSHPVILFLDDLQWADKSSLELITTLVSDRESSSLLFIGSYRNNEVGVGHRLTEEAGSMIFAGVNITNVELENIDKESVNALISDAVHLSPRLTRSLAHVVHAKTSGNPLFVVQFLRSVCEEHLLQYSASSRRWEWDIEAIQSKDIADNVAGLITEKILQLDPCVQKLLKECACLGSRFEVTTLKLLNSDGENKGSGIKSILDLAVEEGLLCQIDSSYKFSHDQIQQAAYSLIPESEREALHLNIGRRLWRRSPEEVLESTVFIVVDQLHRGSDLITDHAEKIEVAGLCLQAGKKAMSSSAFSQAAAIYLLQGTALLDESDWEDHYELSLELFSCCAEALYVTGNHEGVKVSSTPIMKHGRSLQDKLRACLTLFHSLCSQVELHEAMDFGLKCLSQLGEEFPNKIHQSDIMNEFAKTQGMLKKTSMDDILHMNVADDANKVAAMKLFSVMGVCAYRVDQKLMAMLIFRMVQVSGCHGVCAESSLGFASYGAILCSYGELEQGHLYGKLALSLLERFNAKDCLARVYALVHQTIAIFTEPVQAILPLLKQGYETGMAMGDTEWGLTNANAYILLALQCGSNLDRLADEARAYMHLMKEHNHTLFVLIQMFLQTILNLIGYSDDPTMLTGEAMNQEEMLSKALEKGLQQQIASRVNYFRMWLAYLFQRYGVAAETVKCHQEMSGLRPFQPETVVNETLYVGLIAATMARKGEEGDWEQIASDAAEKMNAWATNSSWNFQHKEHLLNAEIAYSKGDLDGAAKEYDDSIRVAEEHGFIHEQALACERAGIFHSENGAPLMATEYFKQSRQCYVEWGAKSKADDLLRWLDDKQLF